MAPGKFKKPSIGSGSPGRFAVPGLLLLFFLAAGCEKEVPELRMTDLTQAEHRYLTRLVVMERAKVVALIDRDAGEALLDSLATAWGDTPRRCAGTTSTGT